MLGLPRKNPEHCGFSVELCKNLNISLYANIVQDSRCCLETYISTFVCIWCISVE